MLNKTVCEKICNKSWWCNRYGTACNLHAMYLLRPNSALLLARVWEEAEPPSYCHYQLEHLMEESNRETQPAIAEPEKE